jgi:hypothetical protein
MSMQTAEWVIAGATLLGPILAVQAQKAIERARENWGRWLKGENNKIFTN